MTSITPPEGFRHITPIQVRWGDMDALGHVNNATYLTYCEQARINYVVDLQLWKGDIESPLGLIMARAEIDYKLPLKAQDEVYVFTRIRRLGRSSFTSDQHIMRRSPQSGALELACAAVITGVVYDYSAGKSAPIPATWRDAIRNYEPAPTEE